MKIVIGAGGTGGHIVPAIAVAKELQAMNWEVSFIGNKNSIEEMLVNKDNFPFHPIHVQKIYRKLTIEHIKFPVLFIKSLLKCFRYMSKIAPDAVFCTGSFISGPVALAAAIKGIPLYFQDGNSYPGLTTRLMSAYTRHIFTASTQANQHLGKASCLLTGNPILKYNKIDKSVIDWASYNLKPDSQKLFVVGGSQGSVLINQTIGNSIKDILAMNIEIIWQTGKAHKLFITEQFGHYKGVHIFDFTDNMSQYYQMSDFAISRAGALSIAELEEHEIPTIYIPLPSAAGNHQFKNAKAQNDKGVGILLEQSRLTPKTLLDALTNLQANLQSYKKKLSLQPKNQATRMIAETIDSEARRK